MPEKEIEVKNVAEAQEKLAEIAKDASINKPTELEKLAAEKKFDEAAKEFNAKLFPIGTEEEATEVADFLLVFLDKFVYWTKNGWMGVLKLDEEIREFKKNYKEGPYGLGYQALEFLFYALTNPGGSGLSSAKEIEKVAEMYGKLVEYTGKELETARAELKDIQFLQEEWNAMLQGFYLEREDGVAPEETESSEEPVREEPSPE